MISVSGLGLELVLVQGSVTRTIPHLYFAFCSYPSVSMRAAEKGTEASQRGVTSDDEQYCRANDSQRGLRCILAVYSQTYRENVQNYCTSGTRRTAPSARHCLPTRNSVVSNLPARSATRLLRFIFVLQCSVPFCGRFVSDRSRPQNGRRA